MADSTQAYQWSGINQQGKRVSGVILLVENQDPQAELKKQGIEVISLKQKSTGNASFFLRKKKVKNKDILLFTRYLSTMMSAGLPIMQALDVIGRDQENKMMQSFITTLRSNISSGKTLAETFSQYPEYFSQLYCSLIKTGEKSGTLDKILKRLANYLEKTEALRRKIKKALTYPVAILIIAFLVSAVLLIFVVPQFDAIFKSFGAQLPTFTQIVVELSAFMRGYWWLLLGLIVAMVWGMRYALREHKIVRNKRDEWMLKIPVIGVVLRKAIIARYCRTLAITLDAGMPIVDAMNSMLDIMGNSVYSNAVLQIRSDVVSGMQLNTSMANTKLFPPMVTQMIAIGEASGSLAEMLNKVADYYEEDVNGVVDNLSTLLEPFIMVLLGIIIGGFVIAMYLPIFKIGSLY